jgi:hypothetical protein
MKQANDGALHLKNREDASQIHMFVAPLSWSGVAGPHAAGRTPPSSASSFCRPARCNAQNTFYRQSNTSEHLRIHRRVQVFCRAQEAIPRAQAESDRRVSLVSKKRSNRVLCNCAYKIDELLVEQVFLYEKLESLQCLHVSVTSDVSGDIRFRLLFFFSLFRRPKVAQALLHQ